MKRLLPTHPPGYTSIQYPLADQLKKFAQEMRVGGLFYAINRLRVQNHLRLGRLVGEDSNGNKYYENTNNAYGAAASTGAAPQLRRRRPLHRVSMPLDARLGPASACAVLAIAWLR
jgi:hypothetical protein